MMFTMSMRALLATAFCSTARPLGGEAPTWWSAACRRTATVRPLAAAQSSTILMALLRRSMPARVGQRVVLDVQVDPGDVVGGDDASRTRPAIELDVGAAVGDLGAGVVGGVPAERGDDVAAAGPDGVDVAAERRRTRSACRCRRSSTPCRSPGSAVWMNAIVRYLSPDWLDEPGEAVAGVRLEVRREDVGGQRDRRRPGRIRWRRRRRRRAGRDDDARPVAAHVGVIDAWG